MQSGVLRGAVWWSRGAAVALLLGATGAAAQQNQGYIDYGQGGALPQSYAAQLEVRLSQLQEQIWNLNGVIEQLQHQNRQLSDQLDRALNDLEFRIQTLEGGGGGVNPSAAPAAPPAPEQPRQASQQPDPAQGNLATLTAPDLSGAQASTLTMPAGDPAAEYNFAYGLLERTDYAAAEQAFTQFLQHYPTDTLAGNARYWLGETYYVRGRFNDAAVAFAQSYQQFPQGNKAVDSLLKLGMSLAALGRRDDACLAFGQLEQSYPTAPATVLRRSQQERSRLQCA